MTRMLLIVVGLGFGPWVAAGVAAEPVVTKQSVSLDGALKIARAVIAAGKARGVDLAVAVVDNAGIPLVVLRADDATEQFVTGATRKAWTAVNFRNSTRAVLADVRKGTQDDGQLPFAEKALFLMGGVPLRDDDEIVGGVGVAGSVNGLDDDAIAVLAAESFAAMKK